ncbi:dihydroxyacetone kinase subunit DhaK [Flavivirga spongiicola]|uniref:Dihydroxyacetone kinase subunit DhaK n=1 Tax=Flavivirga spongiicola TaxID=421621 RepID=A0ABU7Y0A5_9FLAO|nr:dihydroxyacetone kinase subunit DhaK [Flavivirga sp. MEBiC05379]MDO5981125.1 dihydroxyacetone kinase subunit DhaK [Flavivirga sp. MEBiC05379]
MMSEIANTSQIKKFINDPNNITKELLEGYTMAYRDKVTLLDEYTVVRTHPKPQDKVAIVTLGGAGHEPALSGFVGEGMLDCSVVGDIFAAPGAPRLLQALKEFNREAGVLLIVLNHAGDVMSANMAMQMAERHNINVKSILTHDDISAGNSTPDEDRRGLAGCVPLYKILGAAAEEGKSLDELCEIGERFNNQVATLAVAMKSCTHPQNGGIIAELPEGVMEIGMGQHGEGGGGRMELLSADETATYMITQLMEKLEAKTDDRMLLYINGVGATTHMEMNIIFRKSCQILEAAGCQLVEGKITEILTVQEQSGFQMILGKCDDDHAIYLKDCTSDAPYWTVIGKN